MRKLTVAWMVVSLILGGISFAAAADQPEALNGVNLSDAQKVTDTEAQDIRGAAQGPYGPYGGVDAGDDIQNLWGEPGPHHIPHN